MADYYCVIDDVNQLVQQAPFNATSRPTQSQVERMITDTANDIDSMLANVGYVVPVVSGASALSWLRRTCAFGVLGIAQDARGTAANTAVAASGKEVENIWSQRFRARMKALCDPLDPTELGDAPRTGEELEKTGENILRSFVQSLSADDGDYDPDAPVISRNQVL